MEREWIWIRHGMTKGNRERRYIGGRTDEGLCEEGRQRLLENMARHMYPPADRVYVSPMKRCLETAQILYPDIEKEIVPGFRECDFGLFENKNFAELSSLPDYEKWIGSMGKAPFPEGEDPEAFCRRSAGALTDIVKRGRQERRTAFVVHGGTIMAVFSAFDLARKAFYEYRVQNGEGYVCTPDESHGQIVFCGCRRLSGRDTL